MNEAYDPTWYLTRPAVDVVEIFVPLLREDVKISFFEMDMDLHLSFALCFFLKCTFYFEATHAAAGCYGD